MAAIQATLAADASVAAIPRSSRRIRPRASLTNPRSPPLPALVSLLARSHHPSSVAAAPLTLWRSGATPRRQLLSRKTTIHDYIIYGSGLARNTAASTPSPSSSTFDPDLRRPGSALRQAPGPSELVIGLPGVGLVVPPRFPMFPLIPRLCNRRPDLALTQLNSPSPRSSRPSPCVARACPRSSSLALLFAAPLAP